MKKLLLVILGTVSITSFCFAMANRPSNTSADMGNTSMDHVSNTVNEQVNTASTANDNAIPQTQVINNVPAENMAATEVDKTMEGMKNAVMDHSNNSEVNSVVVDNSVTNAETGTVNAENPTLNSTENSTTNQVTTNTTADPAMSGGVIPGTEQKASETGNSDITKNTEAMPPKASGM